ncbi:Oidioi.mRNA.OKI2018_I69.chr1.g1054.t1.cds [Oikopleura dioica]|uniref:Oidioi.mRNA.OKI2018_I69.chr1.g1054.t1.cds n=1 Tax=Oikopleura dioica TaxID=34765 RepID=A0ABN7SLQ8_OIKDI|nr:Oidioi.mRNA.OKI2018_I69.chr1.g1054.t1.cds [Oikopleura dioica]
MAKLFGLALAATASLATAATQADHGLSWGQWGEWSYCGRVGSTVKRRRICQGQITNKALKKTRCLEVLADSNIETKICTEADSPTVAPPSNMVLGRTQREVQPNVVQWQEWQEWSRCNNGMQKRTRFCGKAVERGIRPNSDCKEKNHDSRNVVKNKETRSCIDDVLRGGQDTGYSVSSSRADGRMMSNAAFDRLNVDLSDPRCMYHPGTQKTDLGRIVGGKVACKGCHPHIAMLSYVGFGGYGQFCDGSIINERYILTAAHCFVGWDESPSTYEVLVGAHTKTSEEENQATYLLDEITCHKEYKVTQRQILYDICILKTSERIEFHETVWPICLPDKIEPPNSEELAGMFCTVAGWGDTRFTGDDRILNEVDVPVLTHKTCQEWYEDNNILVDVDQHVCAGYEEGGRDACQGDSGGPFVCNRTDVAGREDPSVNGKVLTGIVSFGVGCAQAKNPGVYTNINHFLPWIHEQISKHDDCYPVNPCQNGGQCYDTIASHTCECTSEWSGDNCEIHVTEITACHNNQCQNGAECILIDSSRGYECKCKDGYGGPFCTIVTDKCVLIDCNFGECEVDSNGQPRCVCPSNWTGSFCNEDVNECLSNPCAAGAGCDNTKGGFECSCPFGFKGDGTIQGTGCSDIDECAEGTHNCGPSSICTNNQGGFKCSCPAGYTGNPPAVKCRPAQKMEAGASCPNIVYELSKVTSNFLKYNDGTPRYEITCGVNGQELSFDDLVADKSITHPISPIKGGAHTDNSCLFRCKPGQMMSAPAFSKVPGSQARIDCVNRAKGVALKPNRNQLRCHGCNPVPGVDFSNCQVKNKKLIVCQAKCSSGGSSVSVRCQKKKGKFIWSASLPKC